jgi:hypothetical protein
MDITNQLQEPPNAENMRKFVAEYLKDYDPIKSVIRIGLNPIHANHIAKEFMESAFVLNLIKSEEERTANVLANPDLMKSEITKQLLSILKNDGESLKASERISAAKMLTDLLQLAPKQVVNESAPVNVMVIPASMDGDSWSALAIKSQSELQAKLVETL